MSAESSDVFDGETRRVTSKELMRVTGVSQHAILRNAKRLIEELDLPLDRHAKNGWRPRQR